MLDPAQYVSRTPDGSWEVALKSSLEAEEEGVRAEFLARVLSLQEKAGKGTRGWFKMAMSVLKEHSSFELLLREGLTVANVSAIRYWLECCVQRMGMRRVLRVLREEDRIRTDRVSLTTYWLPQLARSEGEKAAVKAFLADRQLGGKAGMERV